MSLKLKRFSINTNFIFAYAHIYKKFLSTYFKYINLIQDNMRIYKYKYMKFASAFWRSNEEIVQRKNFLVLLFI